MKFNSIKYNDVMICKHFLQYWSFQGGIPKGQVTQSFNIISLN